MKLYIHFGIYKAGSSYIQYICANQRELLEKNNIYYPYSVEDQKMASGLISKGNADGLDTSLKSEASEKLTKILKHWLDDAKKVNSKIVLISAESLVHHLAIQSRVDLILNCAKLVGFEEIRAMGFFRDLADHALSTYKHRAKSGNIPDYVEWVSDVYETPKLFQNLSVVISSNVDVKWTLRKFQKDSNYLKEAFFRDWLEIEVPKFTEQPIVNESITLSEVKMMNYLKKVYPLVADFFVDDLKSLPKSFKSKDENLQNEVFNCFVLELMKHQEVINGINVFFMTDEHLEVGIPFEIADQTKKTSIEFSEKQLEVIFKRVAFFNALTGKMVRMRRRLVKTLPLYLIKK